MKTLDFLNYRLFDVYVKVYDVGLQRYKVKKISVCDKDSVYLESGLVKCDVSALLYYFINDTNDV